MRRLTALLAAALLTAGCAGARAAPTQAPEPAVRFIVDEGGPWQEIDAADDVVRKVADQPSAPRVVQQVIEVEAPAAPSLPVPTRRTTAAPREHGAPPTKRPEDSARERFLDHPTRIQAGTITFYCPRAFAAEVRMRGEELTDPKPGRRIAQGGAELTCRELTLRGNRIVLRIQEEVDAAVQVTARGDVSFVTDQRGQVLRHDHVRILVITNDGVTPLK